MKAKKKQNERDNTPPPPKMFKFYLGSRERYIIIRSDFDSGNINFIRQISQFQYRLSSVHDGTFTSNPVNSKSWFYFSVTGFPRNTRGKFFIAKVQTLQSIYHSKYNKTYRPVYKVGEEGEWKRLQTQSPLVMREDSQLQCVFQYLFRDESETVYFAFSYPFSYTENLRYLQSLNDYLFCDEFYFHKQILNYSPEKRLIHLLTITSYDHQDGEQEHEQLFNERLFPERARPLKFKKPVILISARVHPGESSSSYTMKGIIDFLTSKTDLRVHLLRKMFVFMIVPMINVDGVFHGHFRMDVEGKNLNRYYIEPCPQKQPAVYAIKELAQFLNKDNRLSFYFDLHAHNAKKGCFIYGNAINDFVEQVESQVFCKLISMNNRIFEYDYCNFTQKHMNAKDWNEDLTKEGCGRVVMHRLAKIIHSYSVQCGIISANKLNNLPDPLNPSFTLEGKTLTEDIYEQNDHQVYKSKNDESPLFTPEMYANLGKNILVSVLDVFDKNPYNRVYNNTKYKSMDMLRRLTAFEVFHQAERFRMFERFVFGKVKNINELIREVLNTKLHYKKLYNFYFFDDKELKEVQWPSNIPGLCKPKPQIQSKLLKIKPSTYQYAQSFWKTLKMSNEESLSKSKVRQSEIIEKQENSQSSETSDYSPEKRIMSEEEVLYLSQRESLDHDTIPNKRELLKSDINFSRDIPANTDFSIQLKDTYDKAFKSKKYHPSVRAIKNQRQEATTSSFKTDREMLAKKQFEEDNTIIRGAEIKKSIYDSIKMEIRQELRKDKSRQFQKKTKRDSQTSEIMGKKSFDLPTKTHKERIKSWSMKRNTNMIEERKQLQLPALGAQMYVVSTSAKAFIKKN